MKKLIGFILFLLLAAVCACALADVAINAANFPDSNFREVMKEFDTDGDGSLSDREISGITTITCENREIASLKGIEFCTSLECLYCRNIKIPTLDLRKNPKLKKFNCFNTPLATLDVSGNPRLEELCCDENKLTTLDVSKNKKLVSFSCIGNKLTSLDVSKNTVLQILYCGNNRLKTLDISNNTKLKELECDQNRLKKLDVSKNKKLHRIDCRKNRLTELNLGNNKLLEILNCSENRLTRLDVSKNPKLCIINCSSNRLTVLTIGRKKYFEALYCQWNRLDKIDVSKCPGFSEGLRKAKRVTKDEYDRLENQWILLWVDRTVTVVAGDYKSKPTLDTTKATVNGLKFRLDKDKKTASFTGPEDKQAESLAIPATIKAYGTTYKVTEIAANACRDLKKLAKVTIGKNVKDIGKNAFSGCENLKDIIIKTTKMEKSGFGSNCFKKIKAKATFKVPKKMLKKYKDWIIKKGKAPKTVKVK